MAEAVTQASLWGGPLIPFHRPQPSLLPLCGLQHHTAPTEKSSISGWQRYHGRRDDEKALGSCAAAAAISDKCASDKCASVHAANLSHVKHIPAQWKRHILTAKLNAHTRRLISTPLVASWSDAHYLYIPGSHGSVFDTNHHSLLKTKWFGPEWLKFSFCVFRVSFESEANYASGRYGFN